MTELSALCVTDAPADVATLNVQLGNDLTPDILLISAVPNVSLGTLATMPFNSEVARDVSKNHVKVIARDAVGSPVYNFSTVTAAHNNLLNNVSSNPIS